MLLDMIESFVLIKIKLMYNIMLASGVLHTELTFAYIMKWSSW